MAEKFLPGDLNVWGEGRDSDLAIRTTENSLMVKVATAHGTAAMVITETDARELVRQLNRLIHD